MGNEQRLLVQIDIESGLANMPFRKAGLGDGRRMGSIP